MEAGKTGKTAGMSLELCFPVKKWGRMGGWVKLKKWVEKLLGGFLEEGNIAPFGNVVSIGSWHFRDCSFWD